MPLVEKARVEAYIPDAVSSDVAQIFIEEFSYTFGGCTADEELKGYYVAHDGRLIADRITILYTDRHLILSKRRKELERYTEILQKAISWALPGEEEILITVTVVYHVTP